MNTGQTQKVSGGTAKSKVPTGFISGAGFFYDNALDVPAFHNLMMVFKTGIAQKKNGEVQ
jgi:hypothetical protein